MATPLIQADPCHSGISRRERAPTDRGLAPVIVNEAMGEQILKETGLGRV